jgi:hypothetical protein
LLIVKAAEGSKFFTKLPPEIRDMIYNLLIEERQFKQPSHPPYSHPPYCVPLPHVSGVTYVGKIAPVNRQYYDEFIAAVCRHPRCSMFVTIKDYSVARYHHRTRFAQLLRPDLPSFYPGNPVIAVVLRRAPERYLEHIRDLKVFCVIDRSDMGMNMYKLRQPGLKDTTPSISGALAIRSMLPSLQNLEIQVFFTVRDVYGINYSLLWIDDQMKPLMKLPPDTIIRAMIVVSDFHNRDEPLRQYMRYWHACPAGPGAKNWLHSHSNGKPDLDGWNYCYRCLIEHQSHHRFKRMEHGWTTRPAEGTFYQTLTSKKNKKLGDSGSVYEETTMIRQNAFTLLSP